MRVRLWGDDEVLNVLSEIFLRVALEGCFCFLVVILSLTALQLGVYGVSLIALGLQLFISVLARIWLKIKSMR